MMSIVLIAANAASLGETYNIGASASVAEPGRDGDAGVQAGDSGLDSVCAVTAGGFTSDWFFVTG